MLAMLGHVREQYGGVEAYLKSAGVSAEQIERLRERLVDP